MQESCGAIGDIADALHIQDEAIGFWCQLHQLADDEFGAVECYFPLQAEAFDAGRDLLEAPGSRRRANAPRRRLGSGISPAQDERRRGCGAKGMQAEVARYVTADSDATSAVAIVVEEGGGNCHVETTRQHGENAGAD